ncbi:hypothetical protein LOD99_13533 [Oopsacas minuta]|uniref:Uncharacterized protein n=1 Tax=Oopsacas minuta TaxID=111878 RepID=A0AAV7KLQ4_9METZ|nr:hypothetical protein LOD99_13533 [Oopsacas minuta]
MSTFPHPRSGPQDPPFLRQATHPNQERDLNKLDHTLSATSYQRSPNFTSPIYSGGGGYQQSSPAFIHPPPQIDMPPYRAQYDARFQMNQPLVPIRPYYPNPRDMNIPFPNYAQSNTPNPSVESLQPPELPPKPRSGQQQQLQPPVQQVQAMNQQPVVNEPVMLPRDTHEQEPNLFQPPPVPARPGQQQTLDPRKSPV